jgi:V8-like Glu-specific endopeptidase
MHAWIRAIVTTVSAGFLFASITELPAFAGKNDDRRKLDELEAPWSAIGQINVTGYRRMSWCTGSLIAPDLVITAAHCVVDQWSGKPFPLHHVHFLAGVTRSNWLDHSTAKCLHFPPNYKYAGSIGPGSRQGQVTSPTNLASDVVVIVLKNDLIKIQPLEIEHSELVDFVLTHAAYSADRRYVLTNQRCHLNERDEKLWLTDCKAFPASSGGPILIERDNKFRLAAIMVASAGTSSVAVPIADWIDIDKMRTCP